MSELTEDELKWLKRMAAEPSGTWPDRPFLRNREASRSLMRKGLVELVKPDAPYLPYAIITKAGQRAAALALHRIGERT